MYLMTACFTDLRILHKFISVLFSKMGGYLGKQEMFQRFLPKVQQKPYNTVRVIAGTRACISPLSRIKAVSIAVTITCIIIINIESPCVSTL